jgi:hypothetical protein
LFYIWKDKLTCNLLHDLFNSPEPVRKPQKTTTFTHIGTIAKPCELQGGNNRLGPVLLECVCDINIQMDGPANKAHEE